MSTVVFLWRPCVSRYEPFGPSSFLTKFIFFPHGVYVARENVLICRKVQILSLAEFRRNVYVCLIQRTCITLANIKISTFLFVFARSFACSLHLFFFCRRLPKG